MTRSNRVPLFLFLLLVLSGCSDGPSNTGGSDVSFQDQIAMALEETSPEFRVKNLGMIAKEQFEAQDTAGASETLRLAKKACEEIPADDHFTRASSFLFLANVQHQIGKRLDAKKSLETAKSDTLLIESPMLRGEHLASIGGHEGSFGDVTTGVETLNKAEELADQLQSLGGNEVFLGKIQVLVSTAKGYDRLGNAEETDRLLGSALETSNAISDARDRCDGLTTVAMAQHDLGGEEVAEATFAAALESARAIDDVLSKAHALAEMAERFSSANRHAQAHAILEEADRIAHQIGEPDLQHQTVERVRTLMGTLPKSNGS